jgi:uncharacterized protein (DUF488 family)
MTALEGVHVADTMVAHMTSTAAPLLATLGYGKRSIGEVIDLLKLHEVEYLVDVRSAPWSRYHPDFSHDALRDHLKAQEIGYLFLGKELGGRPDDASCYDASGRVDYEACTRRPAFQHGIDRLSEAWRQGRRVALLCSESRPEECHRSKLLGPALVERGIEVTHLDEDGSPVSQEEVMARLSNGQLGLFEDVPAAKAVRSRKRYPQAGG